MKKAGLFFLSLLLAGKAFTGQGIDTTEILRIGGIQQYIRIKGADRSRPVLLYLHGGPGTSAMDGAEKFSAKLEQQLVVVQWDQRETGKTLALNGTDGPITLRQMEQDTHDLIDSLLGQFRQKKCYLMAHSWGTVLGFYIAGHYPEWLHAYIAISPLVDQAKSEQMTLTMLKEKARLSGNERALDELSQVKIPFENGKELYFARKWLFFDNGQPIADSDTAAVQQYVAGWAATWLGVWNEAIQEDHFSDLPRIRCPVYFCVGTKDYQTNFTLTESYYNQLHAPKKTLFWFGHSGHLIPSSEPDLLQDIVLQKILPATTR
jgi:pimeloyl-ACP methyl ester carboxylesterase